MKNFIYNSMVLAILFFPMNLLSRIPYRSIWDANWTARVVVGFIVWALWMFMHYMLELNKDNGSGKRKTSAKPRFSENYTTFSWSVKLFSAKKKK